MELSEDRLRSVLSRIMQLPPHREVPGALRRLAGAGVRLAALTNSTQQVAEAQLFNAGLDQLFEQVLSADTVRRLKPAREPYLMAPERLGVDAAQVLLVAAHAWDVAGAMHAGCAAAFVVRPGMVLDPLAPEPDVVATDLDEVANAVLKQAA